MKLHSNHQIGDEVKFIECTAKVIAVHFYEGKVKYDLRLNVGNNESTRIYNVDSYYVKKIAELP
jgi:hypothetical protein